MLKPCERVARDAKGRCDELDVRRQWNFDVLRCRKARGQSLSTVKSNSWFTEQCRGGESLNYCNSNVLESWQNHSG
jgi:hypothetical protein